MSDLRQRLLPFGFIALYIALDAASFIQGVKKLIETLALLLVD